MPKYWGKQIFTHGRFPEVGQKQKTERKRREKDKRRKDSRKSGFFRKKQNDLKDIFFLHISSSYAKILGETNFHTREIPRSGSKAKDGEKKKKKERKD